MGGSERERARESERERGREGGEERDRSSQLHSGRGSWMSNAPPGQMCDILPISRAQCGFSHSLSFSLSLSLALSLSLSHSHSHSLSLTLTFRHATRYPPYTGKACPAYLRLAGTHHHTVSAWEWPHREAGAGPFIIRTRMHDKYSGSTKITTRLDHVSHCKTASGTN